MKIKAAALNAIGAKAPYAKSEPLSIEVIVTRHEFSVGTVRAGADPVPAHVTLL
jgi:hypothetical protein